MISIVFKKFPQAFQNLQPLTEKDFIILSIIRCLKQHKSLFEALNSYSTSVSVNLLHKVHYVVSWVVMLL